MVETTGVRVSQYLGLGPTLGLAMVGQPRPQYYFSRPLGALPGACFDAGFVLDGVREPAFAPDVDSPRPLAWGGRFAEIPPVFAARLRLA